MSLLDRPVTHQAQLLSHLQEYIYKNSTVKGITMKLQLPKKYTHIAFAFYMSAIMAMLMCIVIVALNTGVNGDYFYRVIKAYELAMPSAFVFIQMVRPVVIKLVELTISSDR